MSNDLVERLRERAGQYDEYAWHGAVELEAADEISRLREAFEEIAHWADAYPLDVFPEPDLQRAHEVLKAAGITLDAISAHAMRHVITQVGGIARDALTSTSPSDDAAETPRNGLGAVTAADTLAEGGTNSP